MRRVLTGLMALDAARAGEALGAPRWLGAVTPLGGLAMMAGWLLLGWAARALVVRG